MQPAEKEDSGGRPPPGWMLRRRRTGERGGGDGGSSAAGAAARGPRLIAMPPGLLVALPLLLVWAAATVQTCHAFHQLPPLGFGGLQSVRADESESGGAGGWKDVDLPYYYV